MRDGVKWTSLVHKGPVFAPPYQRLPSTVVFLYDGETIMLSEEAEEVAGFYAKILNQDCTSNEKFMENFFNDWKTVWHLHFVYYCLNCKKTRITSISLGYFSLGL